MSYQEKRMRESNTNKERRLDPFLQEGSSGRNQGGQSTGDGGWRTRSDATSMLNWRSLRDRDDRMSKYAPI